MRRCEVAGNVFTLDELYPQSGGSATSPARFISPEVQADRDRAAAEILQQELRDPRNAENKPALERELAARDPAATPQSPTTLSLDDLYPQPATTTPTSSGGTTKAPDSQGPATPATPTATPAPKAAEPTTYFGKLMRNGKEIMRNAADLGDMFLSMPGGLAANVVSMGGQAKDQVMESFLETGKSHRQIGEEALAKNAELSDRWSTNIFARAVNAVSPDGEVSETGVAKAMNWLTKKIDDGAGFIDKATGGRLTKDEVNLEAQFFMNLAGTKGLAKTAGKLLIGDKTAPPQAKEGITPTFDQATSDFKPVDAPHTMTPEEFAQHSQAWKDNVDAKTTVQAFKETGAREASIAKHPINKAEGPVMDADLQAAIDEASAPLMTPMSGSHRFQRGAVSYDQLRNMGALALGFTAGAYLDPENPIIGGVLGSVGAFGLSKAAGGGLGKVVSSIKAGDVRTRIDDVTQAHQLDIARGARSTWQEAMDVTEQLPKKADRELAYGAYNDPAVTRLTGAPLAAQQKMTQFFTGAAQAAAAAKVTEAVRASVLNKLWDTQDLGAIRDIYKPDPANPLTPLQEAQRLTRVKEGMDAGFVPKSMDGPEIMSVYGDAVNRAVANRKLLDRLRQSATAAGDPLLLPTTKAPGAYATIDNPLMRGVKVHPDIAPSLKFMFEAQDANGVMAGLQAVNTALKRNAVSFSLFHAKALADAMLGATNNPLSVGKVVGQAIAPRIFGKNRYLEQLRKGGVGDEVDKALRDGVKISMEGKETVDADLGNGFYQTLKSTQGFLDKELFKGAGLPIKAYMRVNHAFDNFMWGRLHAAMKLEIYAAKKESLLTNTAKGRTPLSEEAAGKIAADYANTVFGGLNWQRVAESVNNRFGRDLALKTLSPAGMRKLQLVMFAPDWTASTSMAFLKMFGENTGLSGILRAKTSADLFRQQFVRSAFYYSTIGDAVNLYFSGHHFWENKDPTYIDLGDGRKMQMSKHFMEPFHWGDRPVSQAINKLGTIPSEVGAQLQGKEYLSTHPDHVPPMKDRVAHAAWRAAPIGAKQAVEGDPIGAAGGLLGAPIYGKTPEMKQAALAQRRAEQKAKRNAAFQQRMANYRKQAGLDK